MGGEDGIRRVTLLGTGGAKEAAPTCIPSAIAQRRVQGVGLRRLDAHASAAEVFSSLRASAQWESRSMLQA